MKSNEYVKFLTEQLVTYLDTPKSERKKEKSVNESSLYSNNWFGLFPFTIKLLLRK